MVPERYAGKLARARDDRSALSGAVSRKRRCLELGGIPEGIRLQSGTADGERERVSRVVIGLGSGQPRSAAPRKSQAQVSAEKERREPGAPFEIPHVAITPPP